MQKVATFKIKGMQRDLSVSAFNSEFAYENKNVRVMPTDESTLYSLINEKGTKLYDINGIRMPEYLIGTPIGQATLNDSLVVFTTGEDKYKQATIKAATSTIPDIIAEEILIPDIYSLSDDYIYKIKQYKTSSGHGYKGWGLYRGTLGFNIKNPIETIPIYENEDLQKVYWTDGINPPRVINVADTSITTLNSYNKDSFNFVKSLTLNEKVTIERNEVSNGLFAPGVLQYAFTYFNKYGSESNIFYTSPLFYTSYNIRGASPEDTVSNSFDITIDNVDRNFDYLRIYSIHRTSINSTPTVKRVVDISIDSNGKTTYESKTYSGIGSGNEIYLLSNYPNTPPLTYLSDLTPTITDTNTKTWVIDNPRKYYRLGFPNGDYITWETTGGGGITISISYDTYVQVIATTSKTQVTTDSTQIVYTDTGTTGDTVDPTELLYVGGEDVIFGTMSHKDNTLFLGDIQLNRKTIPSVIKNYLSNQTIKFDTITKSLTPPEPNGYYPYSNQLSLNSQQIKTFKYLEYYRFGIQAQHYTGKWSEPIWLNDCQNTVHIDTTFYNNSKIKLPVAKYTLNKANVIKLLLNNGYVRVRPVIVYPTINDRECICQGVLCPTVYNVSDRYNNAPFAQSSWFTRPNAPFDIDNTNNWKTSSALFTGDWGKLGTSSTATDASIYSRAGIMSNNNASVKDTILGHYMDIVNKGSWVEFRHNRAIPSNNQRNAEIQCINNPPATPTVSNSSTDNDILTWISKNSENYYIDQSIVTMHSPDIEFDTDIRSIDSSNLKLRIVGVVPITAFSSDIDIQTSTPVNNYIDSNDFPIGFYKEPFGVENDFSGDAHYGWKGLVSAPFWFDEVTLLKNSGSASSKADLAKAFVVYPWHRDGSLNNTKYAVDGYKSALLDKKIMSNLRYSYKTAYLEYSDLWNCPNGISGVSIFDSNEQTLVKVPAPKNSKLDDINYYGNVDKLLTVPQFGDKKDGYPIVISGVTDKSLSNAHETFVSDYVKLEDTEFRLLCPTKGIDPVRIKYKSTPHAVMALNYNSAGNQQVLPTIKDWNDSNIKWIVNSSSTNLYASDVKLYWDKSNTIHSIKQQVINNIPLGEVSSIGGPSYGFLWLGELYNDNVSNRFGGQTEEAFENNLWVPCGEPVSLLTSSGAIENSVDIVWTEGDTYYQRYDHLKTYPFTQEDQNQVVDIISFMCETRVNIDGRYDRNRGLTNNLYINPTNFNLLNNVYSQTNNFFNYRTINSNKLDLDKFPNTITWTKTKTSGELIDTWTNITLASTLELDGNKGKINALRRFNNDIFAFQDEGISQILYNDNVQIESTQGVPIEIANSGKVNGKRYLTNKIGCTNKWSICESPNGLYFIDNITKGIYLFNGQLANISDKYGFHSWINKNSTTIDPWNPTDFNNFITYYDKVNGDVMFINNEDCLNFSESLGEFTSFYSYEHSPYFTTLNDNGVFINTKKGGLKYRVWENHEGLYNMFFDVYEPFYTTIIANPDMQMDKVFNNIEFRSDTWIGNSLISDITFDTLTVWNEYQTGTSELINLPNKPSSLKKKFRIWRANIPRDDRNGRDRIRNPWAYVKLSMETPNIFKTILHDINVHYFE